MKGQEISNAASYEAWNSNSCYNIPNDFFRFNSISNESFIHGILYRFRKRIIES